MPCGLPCQAKTLLNSGNIQGIAASNWEALRRMTPAQLGTLDGVRLIKILNRMENDGVAAQKLIAKGAGYTGPTGKMLED